MFTLGSIAYVQSGYAFRTKIVDDPSGDHCVIQGKDIRADRSLDPGRLTHIRLPGGRATDKFVRKDDILLMTRGDFPYATHVGIDLPPTVAQNSFCQIRVRNPGQASAEFLAMLLNQQSAQRQLRQMRKGTSIPHIKLADIRTLRLSLPPLKQQHLLLELHAAIKRERAMSQRLTELRQQQLDQLLQSA
jgi:hypothetical protein